MYQEIIAKGVPSYCIMILGHFCKKVTIWVSFLEQDIKKELREFKIPNYLQILLEVV